MGKWVDIPEHWNRVTEAVIGCAMDVGRELGPGLAEVLYERAMDIEIKSRDIACERQTRCVVEYKGTRIGDQVLDMVVEGLVVVELKSIESVNDHHLAQLLGYMRATDLPLGLLINFNAFPLRNGIYRRINPRSQHFTFHHISSSVSSVPSVPLRTPPPEAHL